MITSTLCLALSMFAPQAPVSVPYTTPGGLPVIEVELKNGRKTRAIMDTGAGASVIDSDLVDELKYEKGQAVTAKGPAGSTQVFFIKGVTIKGLGAEAALNPIAAPLKSIAVKLGEKVELVVGYEYLAKRSFEVNPQTKRFTVFEGSYTGSEENAKVLPFKIVGGRPHFEVEFTLANGTKGKSEVAFDTGSSGGLTLGGKAVQEYSIPSIPGKIKHQEGVGGVGAIAFAEMKDVSVAGYSFGQLETDIPAKVDDKNLKKEGLLGMKALKGHRFVVDYPKNRLLIW